MTELKVVIFGSGLMEPTLKETKRISLRKYRPLAHDLEEGELFLGRFADGLDIVLRATQKTEVTTFKKLSDEAAIEDGFPDARTAFQDMKQGFYHDLTLDSPCGIIRYEIPRLAGLPTVRLSPSEE